MLSVLVLGTVTSAAAAAPVACAQGLGIGLLQVPKATLSDPRARNYIIDAVRPGADFTRSFEVCNGTSASLPVALYPDSAAITGGAFALAPGHGVNELTSWITVTPSALTLQPGQAITATVHVTVPIDATAGERYAGVIADTPARATGGIGVGGRVGIRIYLDVASGGAPKNDFTIDTLQAVRRADGTPAVIAQVHNTGARALDMRGDLRLTSGPGGLTGGPFAAVLGTTLAPGDTEPVTVPLPEAIRGGPWTATLALTSGVLQRRARAVITFPDTRGQTAVPVKALALYKDKKVVVPVAVVLLCVLALLLLAVGIISSRRRAR